MEELGIKLPVELIQKTQRIHIVAVFVLATVNIAYNTMVFTDIINLR